MKEQSPCEPGRRVFDEIDLALTVSLAALTEVFDELSTNRKMWWVQSDPLDALKSGVIEIGHQGTCSHGRISNIAEPVFFRIPVINTEMPERGSKQLLLLIHPNSVIPVQANYFCDNGHTLGEMLNALSSCFPPLIDALMYRLEARRGSAEAHGARGSSELDSIQGPDRVAHGNSSILENVMKVSSSSGGCYMSRRPRNLLKFAATQRIDWGFASLPG